MLKTRQIRLHTTGVLTGKHAIVHKTKLKVVFFSIFVHSNQFYYKKIQIDKNTGGGRMWPTFPVKFKTSSVMAQKTILRQNETVYKENIKVCCWH